MHEYNMVRDATNTYLHKTSLRIITWVISTTYLGDCVINRNVQEYRHMCSHADVFMMDYLFFASIITLLFLICILDIATKEFNYQY